MAEYRNGKLYIPDDQLKTLQSRLVRRYEAQPITGGYRTNTGYRILSDVPRDFGLLDQDGNEVWNGKSFTGALRTLDWLWCAVKNIEMVTPRLIVAGDPIFSPDNEVRETVDWIVKTRAVVIDVRAANERDYGWDSQIKVDAMTPAFIHVPMFDDDEHCNTPDDFLRIWELVSRFPRRQPLFVHCHMGINRSTSVIFFLMLATGYMKTPEAAYKALRQRRPSAGLQYAYPALEAALRVKQPGIREPQLASLLGKWADFEESYWTEAKAEQVRHEVRKREDIIKGTIYKVSSEGYYTQERTI